MKILWIALFCTLLLLASSQEIPQQQGFAYQPPQQERSYGMPQHQQGFAYDPMQETGKFPERRYMQQQDNPYGPGYGNHFQERTTPMTSGRGWETGVRKEQESGGSITNIEVQTPNVQADISVMRFWQKSNYERFAKYWEFEKKPGWERCWKYQKNHYYLKKKCCDRPYKEVWQPYWHFKKQGNWNKCWVESGKRFFVRKNCCKKYFDESYWKKGERHWCKSRNFLNRGPKMEKEEEDESTNTQEYKPEEEEEGKEPEKEEREPEKEDEKEHPRPRPPCHKPPCHHPHPEPPCHKPPCPTKPGCPKPPCPISKPPCAMRFWRKGRYNKFSKYWKFVKRPGWEHCWLEKKGRFYLKKICWGKNYYDIWTPFWRFCRAYKWETYWAFSRGFYRVKFESWPVFFSRNFFQVYGNDMTFRKPNEY